MKNETVIQKDSVNREALAKPRSPVVGGLVRGEQGRERESNRCSLQNAGNPVRQLAKTVRLFCATTERARRVDALADMQVGLGTLNSTFSAAGFEVLATFGSALGKLFTALSKDLERVNVSTLRTVSHATDFLDQAVSGRFSGLDPETFPLRMLVVDDDPVCRRTLNFALGHNHIVVRVCDGAEQALRCLEVEGFDVIFTDIMMPGTDGYAFAASLRNLPNHCTTPVVFVTALSDFHTRSKSILTGGCDLIAKPFIPSEVLVKAFTTALRHRWSAVGSELSTRRLGCGTETEAGGDGGGRTELTPCLSQESASSSAPPRPDLTILRGVLTVSQNGGIQALNQEGGELLGFYPSELIGQDIRLLLADDSQEREEGSLRARILAGEFVGQPRLRMLGCRKDRSPIQLLVTMSETRKDGQRVFVLFFRCLSAASARGLTVPEPMSHESDAREITASQLLNRPGAAQGSEVQALPT